MKNEKNTNRLIHEESPYLLQHAYNPVDWYPWGKEALEKAVDEDKPIIVSIGYSACHWCHVMEHECFESREIAGYMNQHFVNIKVDREERPDVDQIYMDAVQAMGINGGWPLNVFLTPDQKPFYGGTYFPPQSWLQLLKNVVNTYSTKRKELINSAERLTEHIGRSEIAKFELAPEEKSWRNEEVIPSLKDLEQHFDAVNGGFQQAPKFPMPSLWKYLLRASGFTGQQDIRSHVIFTLVKMARGGIYDQIGGGFARYSVDAGWLVPHFEKMLYDNGQLISLYSEAFQQTGKELFREVVYDTIEFVERELRSPPGGFYSALDADSEGEEGKFYVWTKAEFVEVAGDDDPEFWNEYFNVTTEGNFEEGKNILTRRYGYEKIADKFDISLEEAKEKYTMIKNQLLERRKRRVRPGLDNKILAGWNGLMLSGLLDAYDAFGDQKFLEFALTNANYLVRDHIKDGRLYRTPAGSKNPVSGYLEDYAFVIKAFLSLYQADFDEKWLREANELTKFVNDHFYDTREEMFFYTDDISTPLISRKKEIFDNVIPGSNSAMAKNLFVLGAVMYNKDYTDRAENMISRISKILIQEPRYLSNWGQFYLMLSNPFAEIAVVGKEAKKIRKELASHYYPNRLFCGTISSSGLPLLKDKKATDGTRIFVCYDKTCKRPVSSSEEALKLMV